MLKSDETTTDASLDFSSYQCGWWREPHRFIQVSCLLMFLFLNPQLTNSTRGMRPVLFEVAARVVSVNSVRLDVCFVRNPTGAALKPVTNELWLEGAKWKCWTERRSSTPPVSARNSSKTIACVRWWHHRGRGLSKDSLGVSDSFSVSWSTRTQKSVLICIKARSGPPSLWRLLKFLMTSRDPLQMHAAPAPARFPDAWRTAFISSVLSTDLAFSVVNMLHGCLLW